MDDVLAKITADEAPKEQQPVEAISEIREFDKTPARRRGGRPKKIHHPKPQVPPSIPKQEEADICFFTESDLDSKGRIKHTYPIYYEHRYLDDMKEEIRRLDRAINDPNVPPGSKGEMRERLSKAKNAMAEFDRVKPDFRKNKDSIAKMVTELSGEIRDSMFTRDQMRKGLADAHEEARRMSEPVIRLSPWLAGIAQKNGIRMNGDRMVTRTDATRLWQMGREALGETRNPEILRRD